jgi:hypothetical protein
MIKTIIAEIARTLFVTAWADREERNKVSHSQENLSDIAPATPEEFLFDAYRLVGHFEAANGMSLICCFRRAWVADHPLAPPPLTPEAELWLSAPEDYLRDYGHCLTMQSLGSGVARTDDHEDYGARHPRWESYLDDEPVIDHIEAEVHSDDRHYEVPFNAVPWFASATSQELADLKAEEWMNAEIADQVALAVEETDTKVADLFRYVRTANLPEDLSGFEVSVDEDSAMKWLEEHRPEEFEKLQDRFENRYICCGVPWTDEHSCGCDDECPKCGAAVSPYESKLLT